MIARIARRIAEKGSGSSSRRFSRRPWQAESNAESQQREPGTPRGQELEERDKKNAELQKQIQEQQKQIGEKEKEIADLEQQLALRKQNSTK
jgi:septal ring factor EnvC (AmiA/AmiB activator)